MELARELVFIVVIFGLGFSWGIDYQAERASAQKAAFEKGRINVSMPMNPEDAAKTFGLLKTLIAQVRAERLADHEHDGD